MQSIRTLYKVGKGPSSSHTMGPERAAKLFREMTPEADRYEVILYGSLAKTGVGHGTDRVLVDTLAPYPTKIVFASVDPGNMKHPNTLDLIAYQDNKEIHWRRRHRCRGRSAACRCRGLSRKFLCRDRTLLSVAARIAAGIRRTERRPGDLELFGAHLACHAPVD